MPDAPVVLAQAADLPKTDRLPALNKPTIGIAQRMGWCNFPRGCRSTICGWTATISFWFSEIVILDGALKIPTLIVGDVELSQQVLFAA